MAGINDYDFPDEEDEEDFNPAQAIGSDDEDDDAKPQLDSDNEDEPSAPRQRSRSAAKDDSKDSDGMVGFGRDEDDGADPNDKSDDDEDGPRRRRAEDEGDEEEEEEEEEEDDEDDDVDGQPSRKRRKRTRGNQFIDEEAEVDEDDEEEPEEDDDLPGDEMHPDDLQELPPGADRDDRKHRELDRQREKEFQLDVEETAARLKERYGRQARAAGGAGAIVPQRLLLPGADDPRIWRLKCRPGKEKDIIFAINARIIERQSSREPIKILSAFERDGVMAGNLYMEANRQEDIIPAVDGISHVFLGTKPMMIPLEEMPDLLRTRKSKQLEPGMYVRLRRGLYSGDVAQIDEIEPNGTDVTLRIVPRLDYGLNEDANAPVEVDATGKRKRTTKPLGHRAPQRLFNESEARKKHSKYVNKSSGLSNAWTYQGEEYIDGFLIKTYRVNALQTENVNPTLEEVTRFASGNEDGTENLDLAALAATLKQSTANDYLPGDKVELFRGEQKGVEGHAVEVYGDVVKMKVDSAGALRGKTIEAPIKDLRKLFREGDHVKVIGGSKYYDEVGMVVRTKDDRVTLLTDSNQQEITVFSKDLREATDSGGNVAGSKYDLFNLVQLDAATVGVVIKVDRESLRVLDQNGSVRTLLPSAISNKLEKRRDAVAVDRDGNEMKIDDQIKESSGEQKSGRVLHLHRHFLFAQNRERSENAGVFVSRHNNVVTVAAKGGRPTNSGIDLSKMNPAMKPNGGPGMGAMMPPPQQKGRDRLIGKTVKIRAGVNKGLIGIVKDSGDTTAKVELHGKTKIITVLRDHLAQIDSHTGKPLNPSEPRGSGGMGGRTPAMNWGQTPFGAGAGGGKTPSYAMASVGGSRTPAWKQDSGARTPAYVGAGHHGGGTEYGGQTSYGGHTAYGGGGATAYGGGSVWGGGQQSTWNPNPSSRTPAYNAGNKTPAYGGMDAATPGVYGDHTTPGGFRGSGAQQYQTPAAYTPGGQFPETPGADGPSYD